MERNVDEELIREIDSDNPSLAQLQELVAQGAKVNGCDKKGFSVLEHALFNRRATGPVVQCLVELGADINAVDNLGYSVLAKATLHLRLDVIELLLTLGVRFDLDDEKLLFTACFDSAPEISTFLLNRGLNPNLMLDPAWSVLEEVEYCRKTVPDWSDQLLAVAKILQDAGARPADQTRAKRLGSWLRMVGYCPTGLYTNSGCLPVQLLPNVTAELCGDFEEWRKLSCRIWNTEVEDIANQNTDLVKELNHRAGLELAAAIKQLVGPSIAVTYTSICPDNEAEDGYRIESLELPAKSENREL
jgi:hypothetical protein